MDGALAEDSGSGIGAALAPNEQDEVELDDREEQEALEEPTNRVAEIPHDPSAEELPSHLPSHEPYRTWFPSCVTGRGNSNQHRFEAKDESACGRSGLWLLSPKGGGAEKEC